MTCVGHANTLNEACLTNDIEKFSSPVLFCEYRRSTSGGAKAHQPIKGQLKPFLWRIRSPERTVLRLLRSCFSYNAAACPMESIFIMPAEYNVRMQVFCVWKPLENRHVFLAHFRPPSSKLTKVQKCVNSVTIWFLQCYNKGCPHGNSV